MRRIKCGDHLRQCQKAVLGSCVPESEEMIDNRPRGVAALAILAHAGRAMTLRQRRAISADEQRDVTIARRTQVERAQDKELARRVREVILAAQYVRDSHARIIHCVAEKERRRLIRAPHDKVADVIAQEALRAMHEIDEVDPLSGRHAKAQRGDESLRLAVRARRGVQIPAGACIARRLAGRKLRAAGHGKLER